MAMLIDFLLGLQLGSSAQDAPNRVSLEGLTFGRGDDGALEVRIRKLATASLRLAHGGLLVPAPQATAGSWSLGPLATAEGTIRAKIADAHLLFDADVTVPIRQGGIDFDDATVEHVGPDSRMGVSPLGLYVDAPNGRSYLYQFPSAPAGVEFEKRNALLGPWVSDRGKLALQAFAEGLLSQARGGPGLGFTEQARTLLARTSLAGDVRLGDGTFAAPGVQAELAGRAAGHNVVRLQSEAIGRGLTADIASLSVRNAVVHAEDTQLHCDEITGTLRIRVLVDGAQSAFTLDLDDVKVSGLRFAVPRSP